MDEAERDEILQQAYDNVGKRDADADELAARRLQNLARVDHVGERDRLEALRRSMPPKPEPKLNTAPPDLDERIAPLLDLIAELVAAGQRQDARIETLETLERELERRALDNDVAEKLAADARKLRAELATLQGCIAELRGVVANEAKRGSATVFDLPHRYSRDLNSRVVCLAPVRS